MSGQVCSVVEVLQAFRCKARDIFKPPSVADIENMQLLLAEIKKYDDQGISEVDKVQLLNGGDHKPAIKSRIEALLEQLNMTMSSISDPGFERVICFHPKVQGGAQIGFFWCFDKVGEQDTAKKIIISDLHRGIDRASGIALREFTALLAVGQAKAYLLNTVHVKASANNQPPNKHSTTQPRRLMSDGSHSLDTLAHTWLEEMLNKLYPQVALHVAHGLAEVNRITGKDRLMELWVINGLRRPFNLKKKSWGALLTLALAQQEFVYGTIAVCGVFPNKYIVDEQGRKRWLVSQDITQGNYDDSTAFCYVTGPNTDVQLHVVNAKDGEFVYDAAVERAVHMEHGVPYRDNDLEGPENFAKQTHLLAAFRQASIWWDQWDDRVHAEIRPNKQSLARPSLGEPSPDNAREYPAWFERQRLLLQNQSEFATTMPTILFSGASIESDAEDEMLQDGSDYDEDSTEDVVDEDEISFARIANGNKKLTADARKKPRLVGAG